MIIAPHKENHLLAMPTKLTGDLRRLLETLPGFFKWSDRNLIFRCTGENIRFFINNFPKAEWIGGSSQYRDDYATKQEAAARTAQMKRDPAIMPDEGGYSYKRQPMEHQRKAFLLSRDLPAFALLMEQGTGKTKVSIDTACYLYQADKIDAVIIIAWPNGVHRNWIEYEFPADCSSPYKAEFWTSNYAAKHRQADFEKLLNKTEALRVMSFNVEAFASDSAGGARDWLLRMLGKWRTLLIIDQSASIANPTAKRTKFLIDKASGLASYRRILDGAPVAEGADELYSQFKFLDPQIIGHDTWTGFKSEFCKIGYFNEISGYINLPELRSRIDGYCYRVLADDCLDLPDRVYKRWKFELTKEEQRIYDELVEVDLAFFDGPDATAKVRAEMGLEPEGEWDEFVSEVDSLEDTGPDDSLEMLEEDRALIKNMRLQQISSGWWPGENFKQIEPEQSGRLKALLLLIKGNPGKCLIFSRFRADLDMLQQVLGKAAVSFHGGIGNEDRDEAKRKFMRDPKTLYFLGQPRSAGIGHTLTAAKNIIFYANDYSLRLREECEKRAHRMGLKHTLVVFDLIADGTNDDKIVKAFRAKKDLSNEIMKDPENFFLRYEN